MLSGLYLFPPKWNGWNNNICFLLGNFRPVYGHLLLIPKQHSTKIDYMVLYFYVWTVRNTYMT
jgi:hypothetical protein